jgi:hypothetical protein
MAAQKKAKLLNEPNLKMTFPAKTLAISHFHPFSKQVKTGKKVSISCCFHAISGRLWGIIGQKLGLFRIGGVKTIKKPNEIEKKPNKSD